MKSNTDMTTPANPRAIFSVMTCLLLLICSSDVYPESHGSDLLQLFPDSGAPTFYGQKSELVVRRQFQPWKRNSNWHPDLDEKSVFHARLQHKSVDE